MGVQRKYNKLMKETARRYTTGGCGPLKKVPQLVCMAHVNR